MGRCRCQRAKREEKSLERLRNKKPCGYIGLQVFLCILPLDDAQRVNEFYKKTLINTYFHGCFQENIRGKYIVGIYSVIKIYP